jgi:methionyl-tRNA formyltransferase
MILTADVYSSDLRFIKAILNKVEIKRVFCEVERASLQVNDFCKFNGIEFTPLESLEKAPTTQNKSKVGLTYGFGMIFSKSKILEYEHGIWNFHPGDLPKYRGRHPITHAFLEGEEVLVITAHQIDERIDLGTLLAKSQVVRSFEDTESSITIKMIDLIESETFDSAFANYQNGEVSKIPFLNYRNNFIGGITITNPTDYSCRQIFDAAMSQASHGGLNIQNKRYREAHYPLGLDIRFKPDLILECKDGEMWMFE